MTIKHYLTGAAAVLLLSASVGNAQTAHDHSTPASTGPQQQAMANHQAMMANMQAAQKKLDDLVAQMNAATGPDKVDRIAAVVSEMAAIHKDMCTQMMNGEGKSNPAGPPEGGPHR